MLNKKLRKEIFKKIKRTYEEDILTYNITLENIEAYMISYVNITTMLSIIEASGKEIRVVLGNEFERWFFKTHNEIINNFWKEGTNGFD